MRESIALPILDQSQVGEARRIALAQASSLGFDESERSNVGIIVTELANNLLRHAKNGLLLLQALEKHQTLGLEILALDKGPGMGDIRQCLEDGFSTAGTSGNGLGAVHRLSSFVEIYSLPGAGTALLCQIWANPILAKESSAPITLGAICTPKTGEEVSGDAWASVTNNDRNLFMVADGLGHGPLAAKASLDAVDIFLANADRTPKEILELLHKALRSTRGAVVAIAQIDLVNQLVCFAGVGNIAGTILSPQTNSNMVSYNGTVGHEVRKIHEFTYPWHPEGLLILHSDGLGTQWRLDRYLGLSQKHPSLIAGVLYRDFNRTRDDVTVLVARQTL